MRGAQSEQLPPQFAQKTERGFAIVHVARAVSHSQNVRRLGQMRHDRVVARHLAVVRVVAAACALDLQPRGHYRPVHIHSHRVQLQAWDHVGNHRRVQPLQPLHRLHRESLEPATDRARGRQHAQLAKTLDQGVVRDVGQVLEAPSAHDQQADE